MAMSLASGIPDNAAVLFDTNPIVYVLEGHPLASRFEPLFADVEAGRIRGIVTPITLAEVASGPLRAGKEALVQRYRHALTTAPGWNLRPIDGDIAILAARFRLRHRLKLSDAIQLATAVQEGCHALISHDRDFGKIREIPVLG
jgi:predicted nucleic acid-binding protein